MAADAADPVVAGQLIDAYRPRTLVLAAGASPLARPLQRQTWETFSRNWEVDVRQVFHWAREALLAPLDPGSVVIAFSSGAAIMGSPLSGGYAGAKATIRFIAGYAADESARAGLGIRFTSVLPRLTPATDLGALAVAGYAARQGIPVAEYVAEQGPVLTPDQVAKAVADLAADPGYDRGGLPAHRGRPASRRVSAGRPPAQAYPVAQAEQQDQAEGPECDPRQRVGRARGRGRAKFGGIAHENSHRERRSTVRRCGTAPFPGICAEAT